MSGFKSLIKVLKNDSKVHSYQVSILYCDRNTRIYLASHTIANLVHENRSGHKNTDIGLNITLTLCAMNGEITSGGIFLPGTENSPTEYDMIIGHKGDARHSPQENKDDEGHMFERRGEGIPHWIGTKLFGQFLP